MATPPATKEGVWPPWWQRILWDLLPGSLPDRFVPPQGGLKAPVFTPPAWISTDLGETTEALELARSSYEAAVSRVTEAEAKASRLLQQSLALMGFAIAAAGFELAFLNPRGWIWLLLALPALVAALASGLAALISAEVDRPGLYSVPQAADLRQHPNMTRAEIQACEKGRFLANWNAGHKLDDVLSARAWFSRGLVLLAIAAIIAVAVQVSPAQATSKSVPTPSAQPSGTPRA